MANEKPLIYLSDARRAILRVAPEVAYFLQGIKPVDAVEVAHGRWEPRTDAFGFVRCSVCHDCNIYDDWPDGKKWNYCPNCGAKMDGGNADGLCKED